MYKFYKKKSRKATYQYMFKNHINIRFTVKHMKYEHFIYICVYIEVERFASYTNTVQHLPLYFRLALIAEENENPVLIAYLKLRYI